jgi:branched-subunit amino acid aminotransferase/4-amino-4-deoxychorismate lyase
MLIEEHLERLLASAEAAAAQADDPWAALEGLVWQLATFEAEDRGMVDILADEDPRSVPAETSGGVLMDRLGTVVARAQAAGAMRGGGCGRQAAARRHDIRRCCEAFHGGSAAGRLNRSQHKLPIG